MSGKDDQVVGRAEIVPGREAIEVVVREEVDGLARGGEPAKEREVVAAVPVRDTPPKVRPGLYRPSDSSRA
jgi:hypothetical protein